MCYYEKGPSIEKNSPCLSIGISACDCRNFRVSGILRNVDNELCPKNLCPYVFIFPFCETSFPADCGGSLHFSVENLLINHVDNFLTIHIDLSGKIITLVFKSYALPHHPSHPSHAGTSQYSHLPPFPQFPIFPIFSP